MKEPTPSSAPGQIPAEGTSWRLPHPATAKAPPYRSAGVRATGLIRLLWLNLAASVAACAIDIWGWLIIASFLGGNATEDDLGRFDTVFGISGLVDSLVFILAAIAWLSWQSRTVDNEVALGIGPSPWSPRWAIGFWFVPLANLVQPYVVHRDIYRRYGDGPSTNIRPVQWWWALWLISNVLSNVAGRLWLQLEGLDSLQGGLILWLIADLLSVALVFPAVELVRRIQVRAEILAGGISGPPTQDAMPVAVSAG